MTAFAFTQDYFIAFPGSLPDWASEEQAKQQLNAACEDIRAYCSQTFTYVEDDEIVVNGTGRATLLLPELPVVAVNSVIVDKGLTTETEILDFRIDRQSGVLFRPSAGACWSGSWPFGFANITVDYNHGYQTVPPNLVNAACQLAHDTIISAGTATNLTSETIAGYSYTKSSGGSLSVHDFSHVLEPYRAQRIPVA